MKKLNNLSIQKCSDTNRNYIIVEVVDADGDCVADVAVNEETKKVEINFYQGLSEKAVDFDDFQQLLSEAKKIVDEDFKQPFPKELEDQLKK